MIRIAILIVSDRTARGETQDQSGSLMAHVTQEQLAADLVDLRVVPDERDQIAAALRGWADGGEVDLILTTGGTGFAARDVTPEATLDVIERAAPGIAEALRAASLVITPHAMLSRGVAGIRGRTLIINLPGNPKAVHENLAILVPVLPHAVELLQQKSPDSAYRYALPGEHSRG